MEFRYPGAEHPVLHDISFTARPGQTTAIVGSTGSGKTTLINLIPRFYDVTGGAVLIDGVDVREMARRDLWAHRRSSRSRRSSSAARSPATCATATRRRPTTRSGRPSRSPRASEFVQRDGGRAWKRPSTRAAPTSRAASASGWRSPGRSSSAPRSTSSTTASPRSTSAPTRSCAPPLPRSCRPRPSSSSPSAWARSSRADQIVVHRRRADRGRRPAPRPARDLPRRTARSSSPSSPRRRRRRHERTPRHGWRPTRRAAAGRRGQRRAAGRRRAQPLAGRHDGHARGKAQGLPRRLPAAAGTSAPGGTPHRDRRDRAGRRQRHASVLGPRILGNATDIIFAGVIGKNLPAGADPGPGGGRPARVRAGPDRRPPVGHDRHAGRRHRLQRPGADPADPGRHLPHQLRVRLGAGLHHGRRHAADRLPAAPRRRREAGAAAAQVLRQPPPGRHPEPCHERHRQHRPDAPAEPDPAHHVGPDRRRRADHDAQHQLRAGGHLAPGRARFDHRDRLHRAAVAEAVRRPVGHHRDAQRPRRGDAHGPRHRDASSAARTRRWPRSRSRTRSSTRPATGPSSSPASSSPR